MEPNFHHKTVKSQLTILWTQKHNRWCWQQESRR